MPFYTPDPVRNEEINLVTNTFVSVIASYNTSGECRPLYFRYSNPDSTYRDIAIVRVISKKPNSIFGTIYSCEIINGEQKQTVSLYWHCETNKWSIRF